MKFVLFVEGHTEQKAVPPFLKRWLDRQLRQPVGIKSVRFDGWPELVKDVEIKARMHLKSPDVIAVVSLLDLYGPTFYPPDALTAAQRQQRGKKFIEQKVNHARFLHAFAVHETEAWLLSQPDLFPREVRDLFPDKIKTPEQVNFNEPPARLLDRLYRQAKRLSYKKVVYGTQLFAQLDPETAYQKCPQLGALLDDLLRLARAAGL